jgi:hypothetical protein
MSMPLLGRAGGVAVVTTISRRSALDGRYVLTGLIASGGMGDVWWATDQRLRREVAVKCSDRCPQRAGAQERRGQARCASLCGVVVAWAVGW